MFSWLFSDPLPVGQDAPDFTLRDQDGNPVSLAELRGKNVVLVFYPADETTLCTKQLCEFRDNWALAQSKDAVVFGVNPADETKHARFLANHSFPFPLLADPGQRIGGCLSHQRADRETHGVPDRQVGKDSLCQARQAGSGRSAGVRRVISWL